MNLNEMSREQLITLYAEKGNLSAMADAKSTSVQRVIYWMKKNKVPYKSSRELSLVHPDFSPTPNFCYLLGALKGDGCVWEKGKIHLVQFTSTSRILAEKVKKAYSEVGLHPWLQINIRKNYGKMIYTVRAKSALFCEYYRELDIKELYKMASSSIKNAVAFLCGFYEAEGCFSDRERRTKSGKSTYHDWSIEIINADLALLLLCKRLLSEYLCIARSNIRWRRTAYVLSLYGRDQILHFLASLQPCIKNGGD